MVVEPLTLWRETDWVEILYLPLCKYIFLDKLLNLSDPQLSFNKVDVIVMPIR